MPYIHMTALYLYNYKIFVFLPQKIRRTIDVDLQHPLPKNQYYELGDGTGTPRNLPVQVVGLIGKTVIDVGAYSYVFKKASYFLINKYHIAGMSFALHLMVYISIIQFTFYFQGNYIRILVFLLYFFTKLIQMGIYQLSITMLRD